MTLDINDLEPLKPDKKQTSNLQLIRAAFRAGFNSGVSFCHESESNNAYYWRSQDWKEFMEKHKIKV